jgi:hypothetical protein
MSPIPREAREGLMRAWLALLSAKHPGVHWIPVSEAHDPKEEAPCDQR